MFYQPLICGDVPYDAKLWECEVFPPHWHSEIEIITCVKGALDIAIEGVSYRMQKQDVLIIAGNEVHEIQKRDPGTLILCLEFGYALLRKQFQHLQTIKFEPRFFSPSAQPLPVGLSEPLHTVCDRILNASQTPARECVIRGNLFILAAYLLNHGIVSEQQEEYPSRKTLFRNMHRILDYVETHYQEKITTETAARFIGYEKTYFCKQFKLATGMSFHQYLNYYRISLSLTYLSDRSNSISDVSEMVGYSSLKLFCRIFKAFTNLSPSEYRKQRPEKQVVVQPAKIN